MTSAYSFVRTELRTLQNLCNGDNELFLNQLSDMIGELTEDRDNLRSELRLIKGKYKERFNEKE